MKHNTLIGITLVGLIMIGFSWYNTKQFNKQQEYQRQQDSIAQVRALDYAAEMAKNNPDTAIIDGAAPTTNSVVLTNNKVGQKYNNVYANSFLEEAFGRESELVTLENDKVEIIYTTKGAQTYKVRVKDYQTSDSSDLWLMKENSSTFGIQFYAGQMLNTKDFTFTQVEKTDTSLVMRLPFSETAYIEHSYVLPQGSYEVKFNINLVGMDDFIPRNVTQFDVLWSMNVPRLEKGYENEKNYSTIVYKYPDENSAENLGLRKDTADESIKTKFSWFAYQQQFFSAILVSEDNFTSGNLNFTFFGEEDESHNLMACNSASQVAYKAGENVTIPFKFYFGPNHFKTLKSYDEGYEKIVPLGGWLIGWINRYVIITLFDFLSRFISNYGIIILIMTILIKLVISPLTIKSYMSSAKMAVLKPEIAKINEKYPKQEDAMKKQQEVMALYKNSGVSMFGGCLPMLLQFPILFAMFRFFPASFELRQQSFLWATDLSAYDSILDFGFKIPLYGDHVSLFALLMAISMFFYSKMNSAQMDTSGQMAGMKFMTVYFMPLFMLVLCNNFSSGLSYYYMLSNLITIAQTWVIKKYFIDEEKIFAKLKENSAKAPKKTKSKFQQRLEAAAKAQQEAVRQQQRRK